MTENIKFQIIKDGKTIDCEIISLLPNPEDENSPYIVYTDFDTSNGYKLLCGQLIEDEEGYIINKITEDYIIDELKTKLNDDIVQLLEENKGAFGNE